MVSRPFTYEGEDHLRRWMDRQRIEIIHVVSPHLDDAVFSLGEFLRRSDFPPRRVFTVFTQPGESASYAHTTGFADANEEFGTRLEEDVRAMRHLGLVFTHCGGQQGRCDQDTVRLTVPPVVDVERPDRLLVLLPLGAGRQLSKTQRYVRRLLRIPFGSPSHSEHLWVRDQFRALAGESIILGYYAECPYQWANRPSDLFHLGRQLCGQAVQGFELVPDAKTKLAAARTYGSQIEAEFGRRETYLLRTASIPERLFLPG
jgi:LmbE family N-acetylglucosaminyl deacetylase